MAALDINAFLALQKQQFDFWQAAQQANGAPAAGVPAAQIPAGMVLVPGVGYVSTERILHALAGPAAAASVPAVAAPAPQSAQPAAMPPFQPPPGMVYVPGWGMVTMEALANAQAQTAGVSRPPTMAYRPPSYGSPRPPYYAGGDAPPPGVAPYNPPQQPRTPAEAFRDAVSIVETAVSVADRFRPPAQQVDREPVIDDDNPIRIIETGPAKVLVNKADGKLRAWETGWANLDKIFDFFSKQAEAIRKNQAKEQQQAPPAQQLPPGYVHVTPGYVPPPGFVVGPPVAVPAAAAPSTQAAPQQQGLPDPPANMPAPMAATPEEQPRRSWGMPPTIPGDS